MNRRQRVAWRIPWSDPQSIALSMDAWASLFHLFIHNKLQEVGIVRLEIMRSLIAVSYHGYGFLVVWLPFVRWWVPSRGWGGYPAVMDTFNYSSSHWYLLLKYIKQVVLKVGLVVKSRAYCHYGRTIMFCCWWHCFFFHIRTALSLGNCNCNRCYAKISTLEIFLQETEANWDLN